MLFPDWETFYVILGAAAGALTGLMFVTIGLHNAWDTVTYTVVSRWKARGR